MIGRHPKETKRAVEREVERYLCTGKHDHDFTGWPGNDYLSCAKTGRRMMEDALVAEVHRLESGMCRQAAAAGEYDRVSPRKLLQRALRMCDAPTAPSWSLCDLEQAGYLETISAKLAAAGFDAWAREFQNRAAWIYKAEEAEYKGTYRGF